MTTALVELAMHSIWSTVHTLHTRLAAKPVLVVQ